MYARFLQGISRNMKQAGSKSIGVAQESLSCIRTVRAFANETLEEERYDQVESRHYQLAKQMGILIGLFQGMTFLGFNVCTFLVMLVGGSLVTRGELKSGALTSFLL